MAFFTVKKCLLVCVLVVAFIVEGQAAKSRKKARGRGFQNFGCAADNDVNKNITALWTHVKLLSQPIEVHVHEDRKKCDDYFGCDFMDHHDHSSHDHSNHSHSHHGHGKGHKSHKSHKHGHGHDHGHDHGHGHGHGHGHSHASHGHGSHGHGHHGDDHSFKDNHIHIHLSVNNKDDCPFVSYAPKDKFVYARCDMQREKGSGLNIKGSILMRQKPHGILETKMVLRGFKGPSPGIKDGKHDFFFDVHDYADFTDGCKSFGTHDHVHHEEGKFDHEHDHKHEHDDHHGHSHGHHDGHDHSVHDHHAHEDDWGNVIINNNGVSKMDVNCTHHELYGPESMFGRGIVLHDKDDKLISCCAITYANIDDEAWEKL